MKKILALLLTITLVLSLGVMSVSALDQGTPSGTADIECIIDETYTVTIPAKVIATTTATAIPGVSVSNLLLEEGNVLKIALPSTTVELSTTGGTKLNATMSKILTQVTSNGAADIGTIVVAAPTKAGTYTGTLTFTLSTGVAS